MTAIPAWRRIAAIVAVCSLVLAACSGDKEKKPAAKASSAAFGFRGDLAGAEGYQPTGELIGDSGFRPETNGYGFENYGEGDFTNLTETEMRLLFGDQVCAYIEGDECLLTPPAQQWMEAQNGSMSGGHCYGFSVSSLGFYKGQVDVAEFGAESTTDLDVANPELQRLIAYSFSFQTLDSVREGQIGGTPNEVLNKLIEALNDKSAEETYTIGFYNAEGGGGHAVTPYAVEDRGDGTFAILIYDNNFPGLTRAIIVDREADQWVYEASTNPDEPSSLYYGDATTRSLFLFPTTPGFGEQFCPFCEEGAEGQALGSGSRVVLGAVAQEQTFNEIYLGGSPENHAHILLTDEEGRQTGYLDGKFVNEMPGVEVIRPFSRQVEDVDIWNITEEPIYRVPTGVTFRITLDGTALEAPDETSVLMIGPGYDLGIEALTLEPGQQDHITFAPDGTALSYETESSESPVLLLGVVDPDADQIFAFQDVDLKDGGTINLGLDLKEGGIILDTTGSKSTGTYGFLMNLLDPELGELEFFHDGIELAPDESATLLYKFWDEEGQGIPLIIERADGSEEKETLTDEQSEA